MVEKQEKDDERADNFLKCLGHGKSMVEIENEEGGKMKMDINFSSTIRIIDSDELDSMLRDIVLELNKRQAGRYEIIHEMTNISKTCPKHHRQLFNTGYCVDCHGYPFGIQEKEGKE